MRVDGIHYVLYGYSGYNERALVDVPFQGAALIPDQSSFNVNMSGGLISV